MSAKKRHEFMWLPLLQRREGVSGGRVCLLNTGIIADVVVGRYVAGESIHEIAGDYFVSDALIEAAIRIALLVRGGGLDSPRARARLARLVPLREPYLVSRQTKRQTKGSIAMGT